MLSEFVRTSLLNLSIFLREQVEHIKSMSFMSVERLVTSVCVNVHHPLLVVLSCQILHPTFLPKNRPLSPSRSNSRLPVYYPTSVAAHPTSRTPSEPPSLASRPP